MEEQAVEVRTQQQEKREEKTKLKQRSQSKNKTTRGEKNATQILHSETICNKGTQAAASPSDVKQLQK